jgi:hypothetical protein
MKHQIDHLEARRREIVASLRERIIASGIPRTRLAVAARLSEMTLRDFDRADWNPRPETIRKVDSFLNGHAEDRKTIRFVPSGRKGRTAKTADRPTGEAA